MLQGGAGQPVLLLGNISAAAVEHCFTQAACCPLLRSHSSPLLQRLREMGLGTAVSVLRGSRCAWVPLRPPGLWTANISGSALRS